MISSVDNNTINMVLNNAKMQGIQSTRNSGAGNTAETSVQSEKAENTDTLELSAQAKSYLNEVNEEESESTVETAASEEINTDELYTYTDSQLKQLLTLGKITQSEYEEEMASRSSAAAEE